MKEKEAKGLFGTLQAFSVHWDHFPEQIIGWCLTIYPIHLVKSPGGENSPLEVQGVTEEVRAAEWRGYSCFKVETKLRPLPLVWDMWWQL